MARPRRSKKRAPNAARGILRTNRRFGLKQLKEGIQDDRPRARRRKKETK